LESYFDNFSHYFLDLLLCSYILESKGRLNGKYAYGYLLMQILNLANILIIMFLLEEFFGGIFMDYGTKVSVT